MRVDIPEIREVEIIGDEIVLTVHPEVELGNVVGIYENAPNASEGNALALIYGPNNKAHIPFKKFSHEPVTDYYIALFTSNEHVYEKIDNPDFDKALSYKVTLYNIEGNESSSSAIKGKSTPCSELTLELYNYFGALTGDVVSRSVTDNNGHFELKLNTPLAPYKPYHITARGTYYSPNEHITISKSLGDDELIVNGSFQKGLDDWMLHPYAKDYFTFLKANGHGNFKLNEGYDGREINICQHVSLPKSSRIRMSGEIRVNKFDTSRPYRTVFFGCMTIPGGGGLLGLHIRHDLKEDELGKWITLSFEGENLQGWPWQSLKFGFDTDGIAEIDVRNISMVEI
ncbi:hypothetical protein I8283_004285 [Serratia marcescens]|nr:hypothetical protein [Serratia marcescens]